MKKKAFIGLGALAILALLVVPAFAAGGGKAKAGASHYTFYHSGDVLPVPPYGSVDEPASSGKLIVNQPEGEVSLVFTAIFDGLTPDKLYYVYLMNYTCPNQPGWSYTHYGCWTRVGSFTTDEYGHADYHQNIWAGELQANSTYNLSVWINNAAAGKTILVSDNFPVAVE